MNIKLPSLRPNIGIPLQSSLAQKVWTGRISAERSCPGFNLFAKRIAIIDRCAKAGRSDAKARLEEIEAAVTLLRQQLSPITGTEGSRTMSDDSNNKTFQVVCSPVGFSLCFAIADFDQFVLNIEKTSLSTKQKKFILYGFAREIRRIFQLALDYQA